MTTVTPTSPAVPSSILNLAPASLPLGGGEYVAVVQGGVTLKAPVNSIPTTGGTSTLYTGGTTTGSANAQAVTVTPASYTFAAGNIVTAIAGFTNTSAMTLNVGGVGAKTVEVASSSGLAALSGGEVEAGIEYMFLTNGTVFQLLNPSNVSGLSVTATGATASRSLAGYFAESLSVTDFGAKGNAVILSSSAVSITSGAAALTVTGGAFTSADVGKSINIPGAGTSGAALSTTIAGYTSSSAVTLAANASTTLSSVATTVTYGTDDTVAIQAALTAAGVNGKVYLPPASYLVSATLNGYVNQVIFGCNPNSTVLVRFGNYGDTLFIGSPYAGACHISGIWFHHVTDYVAGQTALPNLVTSGAHIHLVQGQEAIIENCWTWRTQYGLHLDGCTVTTVSNVQSTLIWDPVNAGCQEGIANIFLDNTSQNCEVIRITKCNSGGNSSASRSNTFTASDGSKTVTQTQNIGAVYNLLNWGCEDLCIEGNFFGGASSNAIFNYPKAGSANLDWRIYGNFFDGAGNTGSHIYFGSQSASVAVNGVTISGNVFNGEEDTFQSITAANQASSGNPSLINFSITNNTFIANVGSCMELIGAQNGVIANNNFTGYNALNVSPGGDSTFAAAILIAGAANYIAVRNNNIGGAVNTGLPSGSYTYLGVVNTASGNNISVQDNTYVGIGTSVNQSGHAVTENQITVTTNHLATVQDEVVQINASATNAQELPLYPPLGREIVYVDIAGNAATNNISFFTGDGTSIHSSGGNIATNYGSRRFRFNGTAWFQIG